jgi:hypothetical protein
MGGVVLNAPTVYSLNRELTQAHVRLEVLQDDLTALRQRVIVPPLPEVDKARLEDARFARVMAGKKSAEHHRYQDLLLEFLKLVRQPRYTHEILCPQWFAFMFDAAKNAYIEQHHDAWHINESGKQHGNKLFLARRNRLRIDDFLELPFEVVQ